MALFLPPGLTCHPHRPFTMASCSRDSTVRLWSLTPLITPLQINILADRPWEEILGNTGVETLHVLDLVSKYGLISLLFSLGCVPSPDSAIEQGAPPLLCGKVSRDIKQEIEKLSGNLRVKKLRWFSECLSVSIARIKCENFPFSQKESWWLFVMKFTSLRVLSQCKKANGNQNL